MAGADDLDRVAIAQLDGQRREVVIDACRHAVVSQLGMHRVGEVHRGRAAWQASDLPLGREHIHLVREQVDLDVLEKLERIAGRVVHLQQAGQPFTGPDLRGFGAAAAKFVLPVGGNAGFGDVMHIARANLHLDLDAAGAHQRGV